MIDRPGKRSNAPVNPGARCRNGPAFRLRGRFARRQQLGEIGAVAGSEVQFNTVFAAEAVANKKNHVSRRRGDRQT